jgi:excisionase family DNA binding protein
MSLLTVSEAARVAGVSRRTIQRSIQSGRLSAATTATGERAIDTAELLRVFGPLRHAPSDTPASMSQPVATNDAPDDTMTMLVEVLRDQLQQAQQEKARLLAMLEAEQQARRDLETKLLPAPRPAPAGKPRLWVLVILLLLALAFASRYFRDGITFPWPF